MIFRQFGPGWPRDLLQARSNIRHEREVVTRSENLPRFDDNAEEERQLPEKI